MSEKTSDAPTRKKPPVGTPCWIEIPAADVPACREFYSRLFPSWDFRPATKECPGDEMAMWSFAGPSGLTGGIRRVAAECKSPEQRSGVGGTVFYFVESIEDIQKQTEELGGTVCSAKEAEDDNGWYMYLKDVAGNRFGIYQLQKYSGSTWCRDVVKTFPNDNDYDERNCIHAVDKACKRGM